MADQGAIGKQHLDRYLRTLDLAYVTEGAYAAQSLQPSASGVGKPFGMNVYAAPYHQSPLLTALPQNGSISGTVQDNSTPVPYCLVLLYWRPNGMLIGQQFTDASGNFTFTGLDPASSNYFVVALDPAGGTQYNDLIFGRLTPT